MVIILQDAMAEVALRTTSNSNECTPRRQWPHSSRTAAPSDADTTRGFPSPASGLPTTSPASGFFTSTTTASNASFYNDKDAEAPVLVATMPKPPSAAIDLDGAEGEELSVATDCGVLGEDCGAMDEI